MKKLLLITAFLTGCASMGRSDCYKEAVKFCKTQPKQLAMQLGSQLTSEQQVQLEKNLYKSCMEMADELDRQCKEEERASRRMSMDATK